MPAHSPRPTAGRRPKAAPRLPTPPEAVPAPATLTDAERVVWQRLAPAAEALQTLVPETVAGFTLLVQTIVRLEDAWRVLDAEGLTIVTETGSRAHPLTTHARQLGQRVESLMARFGLTAPGRAVERPQAPHIETKWERLTRRPDAPRRFEFFPATGTGR